MVVFWSTMLSSFVLCMAERYGKRDGLRSRCDMCHHVLYPIDLIPIVSYLMQKGKCRYCQKPLNKKYIVTETIGLITGIALQMWIKNSFDRYIALGIICSNAYMALVDCRVYEIPYAAMIIQGMLFMLYGMEHMRLDVLFVRVTDSVVVLCVGILMWVSAQLVRRKEMFGMGDVMWIAILWLWIGSKVMNVLCFASLFSLAVCAVRREKIVAFGPYLALFGGMYALSLFTYG